MAEVDGRPHARVEGRGESGHDGVAVALSGRGGRSERGRGGGRATTVCSRLSSQADDGCRRNGSRLSSRADARAGPRRTGRRRNGSRLSSRAGARGSQPGPAETWRAALNLGGEESTWQ